MDGERQLNKAMVFGAGGFIGNHLVNRLKSEGFWVRGVDVKYPEFGQTKADDFIIGDLRDAKVVESLFFRDFDEVYQLAADMGGAGYLFTGENDADVIFNSAQVNLNTAKYCTADKAGRLFFTSSACIYPAYNQTDPDNPVCGEKSAYPADPESDYGWEKLFSERLYQAFHRNHGINVRIARYHNIFGPLGTWQGGREKAPAALCRKIAEATDGTEMEIWGDGRQTRSFLYIDECIEGTVRLMRSDYSDPVNIGSEEMISIADLAEAIIKLSGKQLKIQSVEGPQGVRGRNSDNRLIAEVLGWKPEQPLIQGLATTYQWIASQVAIKNHV
ncbi:Nucleoside-diphosphate-sugar epimerase [Sphingorhabdus sp. 109]|jgi:nucleoside-diphosphate-sugar epimerase|nr:Nucleoside-diphosphate-sugar epimerase [Sphingorhabdus sp. 109]